MNSKKSKRITLTCAGALTALLFTTTAQACSDEAYLGSICATANNYCPKDYVKAEGQTIQIAGNAALYSLLGDNFGGNNTTYFQLPDLRSRTPVSIGGNLDFTIGQQYGQETVTLSVDQMADHTHDAQYVAPQNPTLPATIYASQNTAQKEVPASGDMLAATPMNGFTNSPSSIVSVGGYQSSNGNTTVIGTTGGGKPFSIIDPQTAAQYCIKVKGNYPPRSDYD